MKKMVKLTTEQIESLRKYSKDDLISTITFMDETIVIALNTIGVLMEKGNKDKDALKQVGEMLEHIREKSGR